MAYRAATGRPLKLKPRPKGLRDVMRRHLREEGRTLASLAPLWDMHVNSAYRRFYDKRPFPVQYVETFIEALKLDEFDAHELRLLGALESGWQLDIGIMMQEKTRP